MSARTEDEELQAVALESARTIDIDCFVPADTIGWIWYDTPHYLIRGRASLLNRWVDPQGPKHVGAIAVSSQPMSTVFFITDGSGVGGDNAELARSFKCVVTGPRSQPAARWARTSGEARLENGGAGLLKSCAIPPVS
jgi:hypothetical protein